MKIVSKNTKGSAIFTVVCVMSILIMASMFTFMMIGYAQKRSIVNYQNSQSYVTAKSFLDTCVTAAHDPSLQDSNGGDKICDAIWNAVTGTSAKTPIPVIAPDVPGDIELYGVVLYENEIHSGDPDWVDLTDAGHTNTYFMKVRLIATAKSGIAGEASEATVSQVIKIKKYVTVTPGGPGTPGTRGTPGKPGSNPNRWDSAAKGIDGLGFGSSSRFYGGSSVLNTGNNYAGFAGASGSIYADGDVRTKDSGNNGGIYRLDSGNYIATKGDFIIDNNMSFTSIADKDSKLPFIYTGGQFKNENQATVGTADNPVAVLCHGANINNIPIYGPIYSVGDVVINGNDGVYKAQSAYVNGNLSFTGGIGMNINSSNVAQKFGSQQICYTGTLTLDGKTLDKFDAETKEALESVFVKVDSAESELTFDDNDSDAKTGVNIITPDNSVYNFATRESSYGTDLLSDVDKGTARKTEDILKDDNIDFSGVLGSTVTTPSGGSKITSDMRLTAGQYDNIVIDASKGDVKIVLEGGEYKGNITVKGDNKVQIYTNGDVNMNGFELLTEEIKNSGEIVTGNKNLNVKKDTNGNVIKDSEGNPIKIPLTTAPNIYMYLKSGTNMNVNGQNPSLISAYILGTGTGTKFSTNSTSSTSKKVKVRDSGTESEGKLCVIGSIIANQIDMKQDTGVVYINPSAGRDGDDGGLAGGTPGTPGTPGTSPTSGGSTTYLYKYDGQGSTYFNY